MSFYGVEPLVPRPQRRFVGTAALAGETIAPASIVRTREFGTATLTVGGVSVSPASIVRTRAFGSHTLTRGTIVITPPSIVRTRAFGSHTVSGGTPPAPSGDDSYGPGVPERGGRRWERPKLDVS